MRGREAAAKTVIHGALRHPYGCGWTLDRAPRISSPARRQDPTSRQPVLRLRRGASTLGRRARGRAAARPQLEGAVRGHGALAWYERRLQARPLPTKQVSAGVVAVLAEAPSARVR